METLACEGGEALDKVTQRSYGCPSLEVFKAMFDEAWSNLVWWEVIHSRFIPTQNILQFFY